MMNERSRYKIILGLSLTGLAIAALAGLAEHVEWLGSFCSGFSGGCREAQQFVLLRLPLWAWGLAFYTVLSAAVLWVRRLVPWLIAGAAGFELALMWIALSSDIMCVFCIGNFFVVLLLLIVSLEKRLAWQTLATGLLSLLISVFAISHENDAFFWAFPHVDETRVVAKVGDHIITEEEVEMPIASRIYDFEQKIYELKRQRLDRMIVELVIEKEAEEKGIPVDQLVKELMASKAVAVSDDEVERYYHENRERFTHWKGSEEELKNRIRGFLEQSKSYRNLLEHATSLNAKYGVAVYLDPPGPPHVEVNVDGSESWGPANAPLTIVEFSDYQCPACRQGHATVRKVREIYQGKIKWVFKDYPLKQHTEAMIAAQAARCAAEQGRFWEYQDALFESKERFTVEWFEGHAAELHLDTQEFRKCLESGRYRGKVEEDIREGKRIGVEATPSFVIGGKLISGALPLESFREMIDRELGFEPEGESSEQ